MSDDVVKLQSTMPDEMWEDRLNNAHWDSTIKLVDSRGHTRLELPLYQFIVWAFTYEYIRYIKQHPVTTAAYIIVTLVMAVTHPEFAVVLVTVAVVFMRSDRQ